jgi:hypothetical protein
MGSQVDTNFRSLNAYASDIDQRLFSLQSHLPQMISRAISNANGVDEGRKYGQSTLDQQIIRRLQYLEEVVSSLQEAQQEHYKVPLRYDQEILNDLPEQVNQWEQSPSTRKAKFKEQRDFVEPEPFVSPKKTVQHYDKRQQFDSSASPSKASSVRLKSPPPPVRNVYDDDDHDDDDDYTGGDGGRNKAQESPNIQFNLSHFQSREQNGFPGSDPFTDLRNFTDLLNQEEEIPKHREMYLNDEVVDIPSSQIMFPDADRVSREQEDAATLLQARARGFLARRREVESENIVIDPTDSLVDLTRPGALENPTSPRSFDLFDGANLTEEEIKFCEQTEYQAAQRIQKVYRGAKTRTLIGGAVACDGETDDGVVEVPSSEEEAIVELEAMHSGATSLQKVFRGHKARKDLSGEHSNPVVVVDAGQLSLCGDVNDQSLRDQIHMGMMDIPFSDTTLAEGLFAQEDGGSPRDSNVPDTDDESPRERKENSDGPRVSDVPDELASQRSNNAPQGGARDEEDAVVDKESPRANDSRDEES